MPQMSPIWWLTLMLMFNFMYLMMNAMLYFNYEINKKYLKENKYLTMSWKW
uniref:ATP synthase F0 subunit 8 n=1 Tax=Anidiocerus bimaculatus TaxID=3108262 RepID=UPI002E77A65A|nr:ATP synthase F0 subunit 8 [Anidiocerus bimaculatus]WQF69858.1 ATP synthase F0 subunit 8 [Anidiocerus bimaculatus]